MQCQRATRGRGPGALAAAAAAALAAALATGACVSGPPLGEGQPLSVLLGEERLVAVAASSEVIGAVPDLAAVVADPESVGDLDVPREIAKVAGLQLALGLDGWLALLRPNGRFPARLIGWTVSAADGFRYRRVPEALPKFAYWRGNGIDIAVFEDALVVASSPAEVGTHGQATRSESLSSLTPVVAALRQSRGQPLSRVAVALHLVDLADAIAMLSTPEAAGTLAPLLRAVPLTAVDLQAVAVDVNSDDAGLPVEVVAELTVARPPARRYLPFVRLAIIPLLAELSLPATRIRGVEIGASGNDTAIELRGLMLSAEELTRILSEMVQGAEAAVGNDG